MPLLAEATFAVPSGNSSISPARTILTAESTLPLHSGKVALAFSAISATASRKALRAGLSGRALPDHMSSQEISVTIAIGLTSILWRLNRWGMSAYLAVRLMPFSFGLHHFLPYMIYLYYPQMKLARNK